MSWIVVNPKYATKDGTKVARVQIPYFPDEIDYEKIIGTAFDGEVFEAWRKTGILILATALAYEELKKIMSGDVDVPEAAVRDELTKLSLERQAVTLKWEIVQ